MDWAQKVHPRGAESPLVIFGLTCCLLRAVAKGTTESLCLKEIFSQMTRHHSFRSQWKLPSRKVKAE